MVEYYIRFQIFYISSLFWVPETLQLIAESFVFKFITLPPNAMWFLNLILDGQV